MIDALALAERGLGTVEPNPMVGAVLVREGRIIGRGWHKAFGGPHAEIEALRDAAEAGQDAAGATLYVTLEPCCHTAKKTPPCTDAILAARLSRVVVAMADPDANVRGRGIDLLRRAGLAVDVGLLEDQARRLLDAYVKLRTAGRPWVICKWAQTLDGRIATRTGHSRWVSSEPSRRRVQQLRALCDGVLVGAGTVRADDPELTNRTGRGRTPARVVLDESLEIAPGCRMVRTARETPVLVVTTPQALQAREAKAAGLAAAGVELLPVPAGEGGVDLGAVLDALGGRMWTRVLVEGGSAVLGGMLRQGLADELWVFLAPKILGGREGVPVADGTEIDRMDQALSLPAPQVEVVGADLLLKYRLRD